MSRAPIRAAWAACLVAVVTLAVVGCGATLQQETGVVIQVNGTSPSDIQSFVLRTNDGRLLTFDASLATFDQQSFPPEHLREHQALASPIVVTYRRDGDTMVAVKLADAPVT